MSDVTTGMYPSDNLSTMTVSASGKRPTKYQLLEEKIADQNDRIKDLRFYLNAMFVVWAISTLLILLGGLI